MIAFAAMAVVFTAAPQDRPSETIRVQPNPYRAETTMWRFTDNRTRMLIDQAEYEDRNRALVPTRRRLFAMASALDGMIGRGDCDLARSVAHRAGYRALQAEVTRVCEARQGG
jgi:hypothetical protein